MEKEKLEPKKRFENFINNGPWQQNQLGEYGYFYYGRSAPKWSVSKGAETPCIRYGELYTRYSEKIEDIYSFTNISPENLRFSNGTEVLIPRVGEDPLDFANCSWLSIPNVAIGEMISVYNTDQDPLFTSYMFNGTLKHEFAKRVEGGNVSNLYYSYLENILVSFPTFKEQQKIGEFFKVLDERISNQERKIAKVKALKAAYLTEMFPQEGETVPRRRFEGFTGVWEQRELTDVGDIVTGSTPSTSRSDYYAGDYLFISPADIQENRYVIRTNTTLTKDGFDLGRKVRKGSTLFVSIGSTIGKVGQVYVESTTNQQINSVIPDKNYDDNFVYSSIVNVSNKVKKLEATQAVPIINKSEFGKTKIMVPLEKEEQKLIGDCFVKLDNLITLHQRKLDKLKKMKEAYLEEMFV